MVEMTVPWGECRGNVSRKGRQGGGSGGCERARVKG